MDEASFVEMMGYDSSMMRKSGPKKKLHMDENICLFCALATDDMEVCKRFFMNYHKYLDNEDVIITPISHLTQLISQADVELDLQKFVDMECINMLITFVKSPVRYIPFYCIRMIDILLRERCGLVLVKLLEQEQASNAVTVKSLVDSIIKGIYDFTSVEKREALLSIASLCKFITQEDTMDEDLYVEKVYNVAQQVKNYLLECRSFKALVHCLKLLNISQFKGEVNGAEPALRKAPKDLYTKYGEHDYLEALKFARGLHQGKLLTRELVTIGNDPELMKGAVLDFQRSLAQTIYRFSLVKFDKEKAVTNFKPYGKEFLQLSTSLMVRTQDYATKCYLMAALLSFSDKGYLCTSGEENDDGKEFAATIWETLQRGTDVLNCEKMKQLDENVGWNSYVTVLPERGWDPNTPWIRTGRLDKNYHETHFRLATLSNSLRLLLLKTYSESDLELAEKNLESSTKKKTTPPEIGKCAHCKKDATKKCSQCKSVFYCDTTCQKKHWTKHKHACKKL